MEGLLYDPEHSEIRLGQWELVEQWRSSPSSVLWVDSEDFSPEEINTYLLGQFGFHPLAVQDAMRQRHPPKVESFIGCLFARVRGLDAGAQNIHFKTIDINLFVTSRLIVTRRTGHSINTKAVWDEVIADPKRLSEPVGLAVELLGRIMRRYVEIVLALESRLEELEVEVFSQADDALLAELTGYKSRLKQLRRISQYHEFAISGLNDAVTELVPESKVRDLGHQVTDVKDHITRSLSLAQLHYELATDLIEGYLALSSHRLNQVMQLLTIFTVVFVPLSFLAGIYGMNFEHIPELKHPSAYFVLLAVMGSIVVGLLVAFKRKGWLWSR